MATSSKDEQVILAGDVGGTKTNLGIYVVGKARPICMRTTTLHSRDFPCLEAAIDSFVSQQKIRIISACFGVAGPVIRGKCKITNLPWSMSEARIARRFGYSRVRLLNDLTAMAWSVPLLTSRELAPLNQVPRRKGNIAIVAPGTGLGEAIIVYDHGRYIPVPSEGGHNDFAPRNEDELDLWRYLHARHGHVSCERLLSGPGSVAIYEWLRDSGRYKEPKWLTKRLQDGDPARVITEAALVDGDLLSKASLEMLSSVMGAVAGNLALTCVAIGGVYLGGGIPAKILPVLRGKSFMRAFRDKGRFKGFMDKIPVRVILDSRAALLGAAQCAMSSLGHP